MRVFCVHPGPLTYSQIFLRLEPIGLELVAAAARQNGHMVRLLDLQVEHQRAYFRTLERWRPDVVAFGCNYLANVPEIVDLAKATKARFPGIFVCVGGHSASFTAEAIITHGKGAVDCVLKGEGEAEMPLLLAALESSGAPNTVPGAVTPDGFGPPPVFMHSLDEVTPARDLLRHRGKYFVGILDPCASIEFSRGCPWDCSFCSAWTFYGRSYRLASPSHVVEDLRRIREPGIFVVDDVAFVHEAHAMELGEAIAQAGIRKRYYLETRGDVLLRHKELFRFWQKIGLQYLFLGVEAIDEEGLQRHRKRISLGRNFEALEFARSLGLIVAINLIAEPDWDHERFRVIREWGLDVPEVVNLSVNTPYPGTESWLTEERSLTSCDYRLYDIAHAVVPTRLPLAEFYQELVTTQRAFYRKFAGWRAAYSVAGTVGRQLLRGNPNFLKSLYLLDKLYRPELLLADHDRPVAYELPAPAGGIALARQRPSDFYIYPPRGRKGRAIDAATERFVEETRAGGAPETAVHVAGRSPG
jgi:hopanoid C-3 methylase